MRALIRREGTAVLHPQVFVESCLDHKVSVRFPVAA